MLPIQDRLGEDAGRTRHTRPTIGLTFRSLDVLRWEHKIINRPHPSLTTVVDDAVSHDFLSLHRVIASVIYHLLPSVGLVDHGCLLILAGAAGAIPRPLPFDSAH